MPDFPAVGVSVRELPFKVAATRPLLSAVALSVTAATRAGTHLAADMVAQRYSARSREYLKKFGALFGLLPWALFVMIAGRNIVLSSLSLFEAFPDTGNPGYFIIKLALWLMSAVILAQVSIDLLRRSPREQS